MTEPRLQPDDTPYLNPDGTVWREQFPGQRPPFQKGHRLSVGYGRPSTHGAWSPRTIAPIARRIKKETLEIDGFDYLRAPRFRELFDRYCTEAARLELLEAAIDSMPIEEAVTAKQKRSLLEHAHDQHIRVGNLADKLGMSPASSIEMADEIRAARDHLARVDGRRTERQQLQDALLEAMTAQVETQLRDEIRRRRTTD